MADAVIVKTEWGIVVGGTGTDDTTVDTGTLIIKAMSFAGNADTATCSLTSDKSGTAVSCGKFMSNDTGELNSASGNFMYFGETGVRFTGLKANLSHANDRLYIYLT